MSRTASSDPAFDCQWTAFYNVSNLSADGNPGRFRFSLHSVGSARDDPTIGTLIADLSIDPKLPDSRATWHRNYTPLAPCIRAHVLKQAMGWNGETQLADYFEEHPELAVEYGFVTGEPTEPQTVRPDPPTQSRLREMWHERFSGDFRTIYQYSSTREAMPSAGPKTAMHWSLTHSVTIMNRAADR